MAGRRWPVSELARGGGQQGDYDSTAGEPLAARVASEAAVWMETQEHRAANLHTGGDLNSRTFRGDWLSGAGQGRGELPLGRGRNGR